MSVTDPHSDAALARARWATRLQFMALGVLVGTWGTHIPSVKARYALSEATLSLVLLAVAVGTVLSLFVAGRIVGRLGARKTSALAALVHEPACSASRWSTRAWPRCCRRC